MNFDRQGTAQKALQINLDPEAYGTFAEIGAGQEVARWFFQVGGAAGTVAKSMSAYDMTFSDAIYGPSNRYVSRQRLEAMLDYEFKLLVERLQAKRGDHSRFFVFADTVTARSFKHATDGEGWLGVKFQTEPGSEPSTVIFHLRMLDRTNVGQQEALGIVGVNLVHASLYHWKDPNLFVAELLNELNTDRVQSDLIHFHGPAFAGLDNRLMSLKLVEHGISSSAMFEPDLHAVQPGEVLYHKYLLVLRGKFRPLTKVHVDMVDSALAQMAKDEGITPADIAVLRELSLSNLLADQENVGMDFIRRSETLAALGFRTFLTNYSANYQLSQYLRTQTSKKIAFVVGVDNLIELFDEKYYADLPGKTLEAFGLFLSTNVRLYVYPQTDFTTGQVLTADTISLPPKLFHLYEYLRDNQMIVPIEPLHPEYLQINQDKVLAQILAGDSGWKEAVPAAAIPHIEKLADLGRY
jgi:hypothetical protein